MLHAYGEFWSQFTDFDGRATRKEFWFAEVMNLIVFSLGIILLLNNGTIAGFRHPTTALLVIIVAIAYLLLYVCAAFLPTLALFSRRLNDAGFSYSILFLCLVPVIGWILIFIFLCLPTKNY